MGGAGGPNNQVNYPLNARQCQDQKAREGVVNLARVTDPSPGYRLFAHAIAQIRFHEVVELAVKHGLRVAALVLGAMILD